MNENPTPPINSPAPDVSKRLTRRSDDAWIAGVASGLGAHFGVDATIFRFLFIVLSFIGGLGLILYIAAALLVPRATIDEELARPLVHTIELGPFTRKDFYTRWGAPIAILLAILIFGRFVNTYRFGRFGFQRHGFILPLLIICIGGYLLSDRPSRRAHITAPSSSPSAAPPNGETIAPMTTTPALLKQQREEQLELVRQEKLHRQRERLVRTITMGAVFVVIGLLVLIDRANIAPITIGQVFDAVLGTLGIGLLVSAWIGRARGLIFLGVLLLPFVVFFSVINVPLGGGVGVRAYQPTTVSAIDSDYQLGAGQLTLDLHNLTIPAGTTKRIRVTVGAGLAEIFIPNNVKYEVNGKATAGSVDLFNTTHNGTTVNNHITNLNAKGGLLSIDMEVGTGKADIERLAPGARIYLPNQHVKVVVVTPIPQQLPAGIIPVPPTPSNSRSKVVVK